MFLSLMGKCQVRDKKGRNKFMLNIVLRVRWVERVGGFINVWYKEDNLKKEDYEWKMHKCILKACAPTPFHNVWWTQCIQVEGVQTHEINSRAATIA